LKQQSPVVQAHDKLTSLDDIDADGDGVANRVGFSHLMMEVVPAKSSKILGISTKYNTEAAKNFSYFVNDYFINAVVNGQYPVTLPFAS
jgi:beta-glucosidase